MPDDEQSDLFIDRYRRLEGVVKILLGVARESGALTDAQYRELYDRCGPSRVVA